MSMHFLVYPAPPPPSSEKWEDHRETRGGPTDGRYSSAWIRVCSHGRKSNQAVLI